MMESLKKHWPEYCMEAGLLGMFMISAAVFTCLFEYPHSPLLQTFPDPNLRRFLIGVALGGTAIALIYSPWGKQSGAHMNPAVTLTFYRLGKVKRQDAIFYILFQCFGALAGIYLMALVLGQIFTEAPISYIVTVPGVLGWAIAFAGELLVAFLMMLVVLLTSNHPKFNAWTGFWAGGLVMLYISFEAPLSGFSMNPARSLASALPANIWTAFWGYLIVPPLGMLLAAELYQTLWGRRAVQCAKLHHENDKRCIFNCNYRRSRRLNLSDPLPRS